MTPSCMFNMHLLKNVVMVALVVEVSHEVVNEDLDFKIRIMFEATNILFSS